MIVTTYSYKRIYPVRWVYFCESTAEKVHIKPWEICWFQQASAMVRDYYAESILDCRPFITLHSDLSQPLESIRSCMDKSTVYEIRRGEKLPIDVSINAIDRKTFYSMMVEFYKSKGMQPPSSMAVSQSLSKCDIVAATVDQNIAVVHALMLDAPHRVRLLYSFNSMACDISSQMRGYANRYLHWHEMEYYKSKGIAIYDWGGADPNAAPESPIYGISKFKMAFGGKPVTEWHFLAGGKLADILWHRGLLDRIISDDRFKFRKDDKCAIMPEL
jgi:hypothetical protein